MHTYSSTNEEVKKEIRAYLHVAQARVLVGKKKLYIIFTCIEWIV